MKAGKFYNRETAKVDVKDFRSFEKTVKSKSLENYFYEVDRVINIPIERLPELGQCCHFQTTKNIRSSEVLGVLDDKYGIKEMHITFNHIDKIGVTQISRYPIGMFFVKDWKRNNPKEIELLESINAKRIIKTTSHLKNYLITARSGEKITIITSANPKISSRFEQYSFYNSPDFYDNMLLIYEKIENESK